MVHFDEIHVPLLPEQVDAAWNRRGYTLGYTTVADSNVIVVPLMIWPGVLQTQAPNPVMVTVDGVQYPIFVYQNDTHKNNEFIYREYLQKGLFPHFKPGTSEEQVRRGLVGCVLDDKYRSHWTTAMKDTIKTAGWTHILLRNTKVGAPNDFKVNHLLELDIDKELYAWIEWNVGQVTLQLLFEKHLVRQLQFISSYL